MSKSRLEKFLYALYSLDSSDLPNPLSRIEELYKCLVTGDEAPTFEPLSRVEKYLMAILGAYDVELLPNPLSRVEVLLHKLATCDDNLDDVKSFLSDHEELLAEIIRNGGIGGNIDIEYVLYTLSTEFNTLYNTAEKPVESAILKGNTLVNLWNNNGQHSIAPESWIEQMGGCFKKSTKYLLKYNVLQTNTNNTMLVQYYRNSAWVVNEPTFTKLNEDYYILTTPSTDFNIIRIFYYKDFGTETVILEDIMILEYQDGMESWDIPYFEGMQSVKMPVLKTVGKNLFNESEKIEGYIAIGSLGEQLGTEMKNTWTTPWIKAKPNTSYTIQGGNRNRWQLKSHNNVITSFKDVKTITTLSDTEYIRCYYCSEEYTASNVQIEQGSATSYEPFKSNILTLNEEVKLCGIGDVKDELNLLTGELTQRVGEIVLDGSESWIEDTNGAGVRRYFLGGVGDDLSVDIANSSTLLCDKFTVGSFVWTETNDSVHIIKSNGIYFIDSSVDSLDAFVNKLKTSNIKVQYSLIEKPVKTVDLSVVVQDGNDTELSTFDDITHVTLSSEGLIPEAELEVATKNEEVLNTMSLEMDDILTTQNDLQETSNTQSENVDATMMATTEIYEQIL